MRDVQLSPDGRTLVVTISMRLGRRAGRKLIVAPDGSEVADLPRAKHADETLVRMLAKAWRWQQWLEGGRYRSIRELAEAERVSHSYVSRVLRLTLLAPDLVEAILDGRQPRGMTAQELLREVSVAWGSREVLAAALAARSGLAASREAAVGEAALMRAARDKLRWLLARRRGTRATVATPYDTITRRRDPDEPRRSHRPHSPEAPSGPRRSCSPAAHRAELSGRFDSRHHPS